MPEVRTLNTLSGVRENTFVEFILTYITKKVIYLQQNMIHRVLPPKQNLETRCLTVTLLAVGLFFG